MNAKHPLAAARTDAFLPLFFALLMAVSGLVPAASAQAPPPLPHLGAAAAFASPLLAGSATLFSDNFDDNVLDVSKWTITTPGYSTTEANQRLEMSVREQLETTATVRSSTISRSFSSVAGVDANVNQARHISGSGSVERIRFRLERSDDATKWVEIIVDPWASKVNLQDSNSNVHTLASVMSTGYHGLRLAATGSTYIGYYDATSFQVSSTLFSGASGVKVVFLDITGGSTLGATETAARDDAIVYAYSTAVPPSAPQNLTATSGTPDANGVPVALSWTTPSSNGGSAITGYTLERGPSSGAETTYQNLGNVHSYNDHCPTATDCYYTVRAVNIAGTGAASNEVSYKGAPSVSPIPPPPSVDPDSGLVTVPQTDAGLSPVQIGPLSSQINVAFVLVQAGQPPQVSSSASASGPFELELLFSHLDYSRPLILTIRTVTGIVSASYTVNIAAEDIDGVHASIILDGIPAVVGARYEVDLGTYHGTFYPLQRGGEGIPSYCRGAAIEEVCIAGGLCQDTADQGLVCPGANSCNTADPLTCIESLPGVGPYNGTLDCYVEHSATCSGLDEVLAEVNRQVEELRAAVQECATVSPMSQAAASSLPCQEIYALLQSAIVILEGVIRDAVEGCGLDAPVGGSGTEPADGTCKALIDYALTVPGMVLATVNQLIGDCAQPSATQAQAAVDCQGAIAQVLAVPGVVLGIAKAVIQSCGLNAAGLSASANTDCQSVLATVLALPGTVLPLVTGFVNDCRNDPDSTCGDVVALVSELPGEVLPIVQGLIGQCTNSMTAPMSNVDCGSLLEELGDLPATIRGIILGLVPECFSTQANVNPCGINLSDYLDNLCGSDGCSVPKLKFGLQPSNMASSSSSDGCSDSYHFETKLTDLSKREVRPWDPSVYDTVTLEVSKSFYELTYGDPCSSPTPDMHGYFGLGFAWRGPTYVTRDQHYLVSWEATATGTEIPYNNAPFSHFLGARPVVHFAKPTGSAQVEILNANVVGVDRSNCADGPWPPDLGALLLDLAVRIPAKISNALSLASIAHDYWCASDYSKNWVKQACSGDPDQEVSYCEAVEVRRWNRGLEPRFNSGQQKREDTYGGFIQLHALSSNGTYNMDLWNRMRVVGTVQGPDASYETPFSGWVEQGAQVTAAVGRPPANVQG